MDRCCSPDSLRQEPVWPSKTNAERRGIYSSSKIVKTEALDRRSATASSRSFAKFSLRMRSSICFCSSENGCDQRDGIRGVANPGASPKRRLFLQPLAALADASSAKL